MLTRRGALTAAAAVAFGPEPSAATARDLRSVADGDGDPRRALVGLAVASAEGPAAPARTAAFGRAHLDPDRPMRADSPARVASVSKHVAAIGLMRLVERGQVGLDDDAGAHLGFRLRHPLFPEAPIPVRALLSHRSGLRNGRSFPVPFGRRLADALTDPSAVEDGWWSPPGAPPRAFAYSDTNFACVAQVIERVTGERFDRYMAEHVLRPLGLEAGFNWSGVGQAARDRAAALYRRGPDEAHIDPDAPWTAQLDAAPPPAPEIAVTRAPDAGHTPLDAYRPGDDGFVFSPQGGLRASAADLLTIGRMMAAGGAWNGRRILRRETVALMRTPAWRYDAARPDGELYGGGGLLAYGLGTCLLTGTMGSQGDDLFPGCAGWAGHLGEAYGLVSGLWWNARTGQAFAYIVNGGAGGGGPPAAGRRSAYTRQEERIAAALTGG